MLLNRSNQNNMKNTNQVKVVMSVEQSSWLAGIMATEMENANLTWTQRGWAANLWRQIHDEQGRIWRANRLTDEQVEEREAAEEDK